MSKTNLLFNKKNTILSISNRHKPQAQQVATHREQLNDQDGQKLYTFCSSQQKQQLIQPKEEIQASRERKTSFNNSKSNSFYALSRSKGKINSQAAVPHQQAKKQNSQLNLSHSSMLSERRKTDKPSLRDEKKINISISINRQHLTQLQNKENQEKANNFVHEKAEKPIQLEKREISADTSKKMIMMSEQQLQCFTRKHANQKLRLEEAVERLQRESQEAEQKQRQWKLFKKDSEEYIKYLQKENQDLSASNQSLKQEIIEFTSDRQYYQIARQELKRTIAEQEREIHSLHQQLLQCRKEIDALKLTDSSSKKYRVGGNQQALPLQILLIENEHLKKELELNQKQSSRNLLLLAEIERLRSGNMDLSSANRLLSNQIRDIYSFKIKQAVHEQTIDELNAVASQLGKENRMLKQRLARRQVSEQQPRSEFQFRLDTSPQSPSEVEVIWKRSQQWAGESQGVPDYFDHNFFSGHLPLSS